ncbi:hypothetical protein EGW08_018335, partial [Elysia chlorotica]
MEKLEVIKNDDYLSHLPPELLEKILADPMLGSSDVFSFSRTCTVCAEVASWNSLWKIKFKQRWPSIFRKVTNFFASTKGQTSIKWKSVYKHRMLVKRAVLSRVFEIGRANYMEEDKYQLAMNEINAYNFAEAESSDLAETSGSDVGLAHIFVINELREASKGGHVWTNLTRKFYAEKCLHCLSHEDLRPEVEAILTSNSNSIDLEEGATLIAQWMQPTEDFSLEDIKRQLDSLAEEVKTQLRISCPTHPLFDADLAAKCLKPEDTESLWSPSNCKVIMAAIEQLMKAKFNQDFTQYSHPYKSYINCVLRDRQAIPITLCLILMGIARRLGVVLEPVSYPETFIVRWLESPFRSGRERYTYVDPFNGRYSMSSVELTSPATEQCSKHEVLMRMLRNLLNTWRQTLAQHERRQTMLRYVVEMKCMVDLSNYHHVILMVQLLLQLEVNIQWAINLIQELVAIHPALTTALSDIPLKCETMLSSLREKVGKPRTDKVKRRADHPEIKYAVGLIMQHNKYDYRCVVCGWDSTCQAPEEWIRQMGVDRLPDGRNQPFYRVWVEDGSERYAAQENLRVAPTPGEVTVTKIGRMFDCYNGLFYEANPYLASDYPDDTESCRSLMDSFMKELPE